MRVFAFSETGYIDRCPAPYDSCFHHGHYETKLEAAVAFLEWQGRTPSSSEPAQFRSPVETEEAAAHHEQAFC